MLIDNSWQRTVGLKSLDDVFLVSVTNFNQTKGHSACYVCVYITM